MTRLTCGSLRAFCLALANLLAVIACSEDNDVSPTALDGSRLSPSYAGAPTDAPRTMDVEYLDLANEVPGFGGMYRSKTGERVAWLKDMSRAAEAEVAVRRFAERRGDRDIEPVRSIPALFEWGELYVWRRSLDELLVVPGIVWTDIDEAKNRMDVGLADQGRRGFVLAEAGVRGIPAGAIEFEDADYPITEASLQNTVRPVAGGLQIKRSNGVTCTLGFIGTSGSVWFATNSHCTSDVFFNGVRVADGAVNNVQWYQASVSGSNFIGTEQIDPPFFSGGSCPAGTVCRWSDSSLASFGTGNLAQGKIKRTSGANNGSLTIVGDFRIVEERAFPDLGMTLHKVGRTTGWTSGTVSDTCQNISIGAGSPKLFLCQDFVSYSSSGGDSGSPVFRVLTGNDIQLIGIHWGRTASNKAIMSAMVNIEFETLKLNTCDPAVPAFNCGS